MMISYVRFVCGGCFCSNAKLDAEWIGICVEGPFSGIVICAHGIDTVDRQLLTASFLQLWAFRRLNISGNLE